MPNANLVPLENVRRWPREINSLLKTNENVHTSWSITDSCISLESQKESFNERIQKLEIEKDKMSKAFEQLLEKFNEASFYRKLWCIGQNSLQHPSSTFLSKEFVTFDDLENHPFIQKMKE
uniref:Uncharacterized protein n=1 Tax=Meloidogyne javanica TaxID=6303 RepID=A0A915MKK6_MELJA